MTPSCGIGGGKTQGKGLGLQLQGAGEVQIITQVDHPLDLAQGKPAFGSQIPGRSDDIQAASASGGKTWAARPMALASWAVSGPAGEAQFLGQALAHQSGQALAASQAGHQARD